MCVTPYRGFFHLTLRIDIVDNKPQQKLIKSLLFAPTNELIECIEFAITALSDHK